MPDSPDSSISTDANTNMAVIGGGITGLAAAHRLITLDDSLHVTLFEASDRLGGLIRTEQTDGWLMEFGPDAFITNKPGGVELCEELGFTDQLIPTDNTFRRSLVLTDGKPQPVPDGFMLMAPSNLQAIEETPVLTAEGKRRLLQEADIPAQTGNADESLAAFVRRRFGDETFERLVQPLVGGIYTADPEKLSLRATLPRFPDMEQSHGSVIAATLAENENKASSQQASAGSGARYGLFTTPVNGLSSLVKALTDNLRASGRVTICTSTAIEAVDSTSNDSWKMCLANGASQTFNSVLLALPAYKVAKLLKGNEYDHLASRLKNIPYASSAIVLTGHRLEDFEHSLDAFGIVIPHKENRHILAVSFTSRKFPGRAPAGHVLVRTFVGGAMQPEELDRSDAEISTIVNEELTSIFGMKTAPEFCHVVRYNNAMPQYHVGHLSLTDRIEQLTREQQGLELAGNAYRGVGIPDSISSGRAAAERLLVEQQR